MPTSKRAAEKRGVCKGYCENPKRVRLYDDPRSPPLDTKPCVCRDCRIMFLEELLDAGEQGVRELGEEITRLRLSAREYRDPQQTRATAKEAQRGREVVDCVMRIIIPSQKHIDHSRVVECAVQMTRDELDLVQTAHAKDRLMINYIREDKA